MNKQNQENAGSLPVTNAKATNEALSQITIAKTSIDQFNSREIGSSVFSNKSMLITLIFDWYAKYWRHSLISSYRLRPALHT